MTNEPQLGNHLRIVGRRSWVILLTGVIAFAFTYAWQASKPDVYRAEGLVQVTVPVDMADDGDITDFRARSYAELAASPALLGPAATRSKLGLDLEEASDLVEIEVPGPPGYIEVKADGPTPAAATSLTDAVLTTLIERIEADAAPSAAIADAPAAGSDPPSDSMSLVARIVAPAVADPQPVSPTPIPISIVAGLVAAIVVAEIAVLLWHVSGRLSLVNPASDVNALLGVRTIDRTGPHPEALVPFAIGQLSDQPVVTVLQSGNVPSAEVAMELEQAFALGEYRVLTVDAGTGRTAVSLTSGGTDRMAAQLDTLAGPNEYNPRVLHHIVDVVGARTTVVSATTATHPEGAFDTLREFPDAVVLVVDPRKITKKELSRQATAISDVGGSLAAVVLHREPRRPVTLSLAAGESL
ncbi:MAG: hypothetical protein GY929_02100 [Actinomycetia bacterium]|nr:hypothetical protein [Actinomycetes bacterium]